MGDKSEEKVDGSAATGSRAKIAEAAQSYWRRLKGGATSYPWTTAGLVALGLILALALRWTLLDFKSLDFYASLKPWYNTIKSEGFGAFATPFSTYNPPYLYLLYIIARFLPDIPAVLAVKLPGLIADFCCGYLVFLIVRLRDPKRTAPPILAAMAVLFAPTVVLNSAFWGQADSLLAAGLLACVYLMMTERPAWAMLFFGIALAFKLQAIFLAPVLLALTLQGEIPWKSLLLIPLVLFLALVPAWASGRPMGELIGVYAYQTSQFEVITMKAASAYVWVPGSKQVFNLLYVPGIIMGAAAAFIWCIVVYKSRRDISSRLLLELGLVSTLVVPFFLPKMHERYFYPADILSIAFAFFYPRLYFVPLLVQAVSFLSYQPFLFEREIVPLPVLAAVMLGTIGMLFYHSTRQLYSPMIGRREVEAALEKSASDPETTTNGPP